MGNPKHIGEHVADYMPGNNREKLHCERHGDYDGWIQTLANGREVPSQCPKCFDQETLEKTEDVIKQKRSEVYNKHANMLETQGVPRRFSNKSLKDYVAETQQQKTALKCCQSYVKKFDRVKTMGTSLVFLGKPGTGKTHLACGIASDLIEAGHSVLFIEAIKAFRQVKNTYGTNGGKTEEQVINMFSRFDLLILDEIGVQFGSHTEEMITTEIINDRYKAVKPTILISNLNLQGLSEYIGERVVDRMQENGGSLLTFDWESYRKRKPSPPQE